MINTCYNVHKIVLSLCMMLKLKKWIIVKAHFICPSNKCTSTMISYNNSYIVHSENTLNSKKKAIYAYFHSAVTLTFPIE